MRRKNHLYNHGPNKQNKISTISFDKEGISEKQLTARQKAQLAAKQRVEKRIELNKQAFYDIDNIVSGIEFRNHRALIFNFFKKGYADASFDSKLFKEDIARMSESRLRSRAEIGKRWQINIISAYMIFRNGPKPGDSGTEFMNLATQLEMYGCQCSPNGLEGNVLFLGTKGPNLDILDSICHKRNSCYRCIKMEMPTCKYSTAYESSLITNKDTNEIVFTCLDPIGSCPRRLCECDKNYFGKRSDLSMTYNSAFSVDNGFTLKFGSCDAVDRSNTGIYDTCCGVGGDRKPIRGHIKKICTFVPERIDPKTIIQFFDVAPKFLHWSQMLRRRSNI